MKLTVSTEVEIDDEDYEKIKLYEWRITINEGKAYAFAYHKDEGIVSMHRLILNLQTGDGNHSDHINGNTLDNRKSNLRIVTQQQNNWNASKALFNKIGRPCSSKYKGVHWDSYKKRWRAEVNCNGSRYRLGYFKVEEDAARAYNKKALELFGEYAKLNEV